MYKHLVLAFSVLAGSQTFSTHALPTMPSFSALRSIVKNVACSTVSSVTQFSKAQGAKLATISGKAAKSAGNVIAAQTKNLGLCLKSGAQTLGKKAVNQISRGSKALITTITNNPKKSAQIATLAALIGLEAVLINKLIQRRKAQLAKEKADRMEDTIKALCGPAYAENQVHAGTQTDPYTVTLF